MSAPDPRPNPDLTPAQDDAVRALLASARHTEPIPDEVAARLDATLASLTGDRHETRAPVVTLASRRRRTASTLLLAAAAVVVAGVGIGQVLSTDGADDSAGSGSESVMSTQDRAAGKSDGVPYSAEAEAPDEGGAELQNDSSARTAPSPGSGLLAELRSLSSDTALRPQVRKLRSVSAATASDPASDTACAGPDVGSGTTVPVTYDGVPGALVFRLPSGSSQRVDVFLCGEREALRTLTLRAP